MQNANPDVDLRKHRTLGYIANRGGALVRVPIGAHADEPTRIQWPNAAMDRGCTEDKQRLINAEFAPNSADALTAAQWL
eukprot:4054542-Pyramimonas_sp.AAC.1